MARRRLAREPLNFALFEGEQDVGWIAPLSTHDLIPEALLSEVVVLRLALALHPPKVVIGRDGPEEIAQLVGISASVKAHADKLIGKSDGNANFVEQRSVL